MHNELNDTRYVHRADRFSGFSVDAIAIDSKGDVVVTGGPGDGAVNEPRTTRVTVKYTQEPSRFLRGDCNLDEAVDISDAICILHRLFLSGVTPGCIAATNVNGLDNVDLSDPIYLLTHLFLAGPSPVGPFPECGRGELGDDIQLGCGETPCR